LTVGGAELDGARASWRSSSTRQCSRLHSGQRSSRVRPRPVSTTVPSARLRAPGNDHLPSRLVKRYICFCMHFCYTAAYVVLC